MTDGTNRTGRRPGVIPGMAVAGALMFGAGMAPAQDLVWARYGDIDSLDPHRATSTLSMQVWDQIYDTLLAFDMDGNPVPTWPRAARSSDDGLEYTFKLHDGIMCHDGTPFDADDVKFTIDRAFGDTPSLTKTSWGPITEVDVVDPLTVKVTLESQLRRVHAVPCRQLLVDGLRQQHGGHVRVLHRHRHRPRSSSSNGSRATRSPWRRTPTSRNFGKPVENDGPPHIDGCSIRTVPEPQTRLAALRTGEVHIAEPPFDDIEADQGSRASSTSSWRRTPDRTSSGNSPSRVRPSTTSAPVRPWPMPPMPRWRSTSSMAG